MSRHEIEASVPNVSVAIGCDNPMATFFAQVVRVEIKESNDDDDDVMLLWIGGEHHEVSRAEDLIRPLAPFAVLTSDHIDMLEADRAASAGRGATGLQNAWESRSK
jgi:hypothetical protein